MYIGPAKRMEIRQAKLIKVGRAEFQLASSVTRISRTFSPRMFPGTCSTGICAPWASSAPRAEPPPRHTPSLARWPRAALAAGTVRRGGRRPLAGRSGARRAQPPSILERKSRNAPTTRRPEKVFARPLSPADRDLAESTGAAATALSRQLPRKLRPRAVASISKGAGSVGSAAAATSRATARAESLRHSSLFSSLVLSSRGLSSLGLSSRVR